ncbi:MMPL family transporter [Solwaraspora sp. WMMD791]|uniref:MMPL family transporter n=1 Tax=Solwaraspora sp. WMMD791 TaxID=3016086 RepID=UPI00249A2490|nr:MMPL family transporter [Solwaraspora sp. WMMD791]WFE26946.1 MMPL family transporter [Solwaraspora sp. WMMD791]
MASLLYRLGHASFRRRWLTLAGWTLVLTLLGVGAANLSGPTSDEVSIPGTESWRAMEVLAEEFDTGLTGTSTKVVFTAPEGATMADPAQVAAVSGVVDALRSAPQVAAVDDPYTAGAVSPDGTTAYATVTYPVPATEVTAESREALRDAGDTARDAGLGVEYSGDVVAETESSEAAEVIGLVVAALVLLITFGSLRAAGLPLLTAVIGVATGLLGISIATGFTELSSNVSALATMLGLAVGIDYALFIVTRYRQELTAGRDGADAAGRAVGTAGSAVVFAGLTVVIALAALTVVGVPFLAAMGVAAAGTVTVAVVVSLSLVPALLGVAGRKVLPRSRRTVAATPADVTDAAAADAADGGWRPARTPFGQRWARGVVRYRVPVLIGSVAVAAVISVPALDLRMTLPSDGAAPPESTQRKAYDQLAGAFGAGINGPLLIVVEADAGTAAAAGEQARRLAADLPDVVLATAPTVNPAGDVATVTVVPRTGPTSAQTRELVEEIRAGRDGFSAATGGATLAVTGWSAIDVDVTKKINDALLRYLAVVVGCALLLLMVVFRSIVVPIKATAGFLLSVAAAFGALVFTFQQGNLAGLLGIESPGPIVSFAPIFLVGILFGLAMDYEVFLVTRIREEFVHGGTPDGAIVSGMAHSVRVVTAAALIMAAVFAGFVLADDIVIASVGFALAFGIVVDAFLVRMTIGPAVMSLLGRSVWWLPGWLDRLLPDVDVEGARLARRLATAAPEPASRLLTTTDA